MADAYSYAKDKIIIAKIDADGDGKAMGKKYGVTGYPSECMFTFSAFDAVLIQTYSTEVVRC